MGIYLNSPEDDGSKRVIISLMPSARPIDRLEARTGKIPEGKLLLALVDSGPFKALAVLFNQRERDEFTDAQDWRPRRYYEVDFDDVAPFLSEALPTPT